MDSGRHVARSNQQSDDESDRPLSARSVMASLLLGRRPARATGRDLIRWCALFGISAGTARVALHRMTAAGELERGEAGHAPARGGTGGE